MTAELASFVFAAFAVFCRIGACLMLVPGFGSVRIPMQIRLLVAGAISLSLMPLVAGRVSAALAGVADSMRPLLLLGEIFTGVLIGLISRTYLLALQFAATFIANAAGLASTPGVPIDDAEPLPAITSFVSLSATMLIILADLHWELFRALIASYDALPVQAGFDIGWYLEQLLDKTGDAFLLALRLCGPFVAYAVVVNLAIGLANKFTPQISVYFASLGVVAAGGLLLVYFTIGDGLGVFLQDYSAWLSGV